MIDPPAEPKSTAEIQEETSPESATATPLASRRDPYFVRLGDRVRRLRARAGLTRKELARDADVSERHLANLESGSGNPSLQILRQIAQAFHCSIAELLDDTTGGNADWPLIRDYLVGRSAEDLAQARRVLMELFDGGRERRHNHIALIGLRGAGKSTLGRRLAEDLRYPFIEISREVERIAGCPPTEIHALYGVTAYRRYEKQALEDVIRRQPNAVIATPGGLVSEPSTFNILLQNCLTIWLRATPQDHMSRVVAQGDLRPMAGNRQAMDDLELILAERTPFYAKADLSFDTSGRSVDACFQALRGLIRDALAR